MTGKLPDVTDGNFQSEVLESEQPVLVDFWAPWCGPCRVVHPILEEMAAERDDLAIVSINVDENQQTAARFDVLSIPTLILFRDGAEAKRVIGAMPKRTPRGRARAGARRLSADAPVPGRPQVSSPSAASSWASESRTASAMPRASADGGKSGRGTATTRIPAALAERIPLVRVLDRDARAPERLPAAEPPRDRRPAPAFLAAPPRRRPLPGRARRMPASSSTRSISGRFAEEATASGQRSASARTVSTACGQQRDPAPVVGLESLDHGG